MDSIPTRKCEKCSQEMYCAENYDEYVYICFKCQIQSVVKKRSEPISDPMDLEYYIPRNDYDPNEDTYIPYNLG